MWARRWALALAWVSTRALAGTLAGTVNRTVTGTAVGMVAGTVPGSGPLSASRRPGPGRTLRRPARRRRPPPGPGHPQPPARTWGSRVPGDHRAGPGATPAAGAAPVRHRR